MIPAAVIAVVAAGAASAQEVHEPWGGPVRDVVPSTQDEVVEANIRCLFLIDRFSVAHVERDPDFAAALDTSFRWFRAFTLSSFAAAGVEEDDVRGRLVEVLDTVQQRYIATEREGRVFQFPSFDHLVADDAETCHRMAQTGLARGGAPFEP